MGVVIDSFKESLKIIRENKVITAVSLVYILIFNTDILSTELNLPLNIFSFVVFPLFAGGSFGMVYEAMNRPAQLSTFAKTGKKNYVRLLIASIVVTVFTSGPMYLMLPTVLDRIYGRWMYFSYFSELFNVVVLISFLFTISFQFYHVGIVIGGFGALESLIESFRFVKSNILPVVFFNLARIPFEAIPSLMSALVFTYNAGHIFNPLNFWDRNADPILFRIPIDFNPEHVLINLSTALLMAIALAFTLTFTAVFYVKAQESG